MNQEATYDWLFEHGGPVIKYRTVLELMPNISKKNFEVTKLYNDLIKSIYIQKWLAVQHETSRSPWGVHGAKRSYFENYVPKLAQLGIVKGNQTIDIWVQPFIKSLQKSVENSYNLQHFNLVLISSFLGMAGYANNKSKVGSAIIAVLKYQITIINNMIDKMGYNVYVDSNDYRAMPKNFRGKPLFNPKITQNDSLEMPSIYNFLGFSALQKSKLLEDEDQKRLDKIVEYILQPEYQKLHPFPVGLYMGNKYYAGAYQMLLPGYFQDPIINIKATHPRTMKFFMAVFLMAHFPIAVNHPWFKKAIIFLETFKTEKGTYIFPRDFLPEKNQGYWIFSTYMGLGENRRKKIWLELESTFWMMKIKKISEIE